MFYKGNIFRGTLKYIIRHFIGDNKKVTVWLLRSSILCILFSHLDKTICYICVVLHSTFALKL